MGFEDFVPAQMHGQVAPAQARPAAPGDELFAFDGEPGAEPGAGAELDRELSKAPGEAPPAPALPQARPPGPAPSTLAHPAPAEPSERAPGPPRPLLGATLPPPEPAPPAAKGLAIGPAMFGVLILLLIANLLTLVAGWKSQSEVGGLLERAGRRAPLEFEQLRQQALDDARRLNERDQPLPARPEGYETLDVAQRAIEQGDFERARRGLYALQAVADRLDESVRDDVLARAAFMIGDAYRLEAQSLALAAGQEQPR